MPGVSGVTVVTTLVCSFYFACEAAGASSARHSLRPRFLEGISIIPRTQMASREGGHTPRRHCLRQTQSVCARERKRRSNPTSLPRQNGLLRYRSQWKFVDTFVNGESDGTG